MRSRFSEMLKRGLDIQCQAPAANRHIGPDVAALWSTIEKRDPPGLALSERYEANSSTYQHRQSEDADFQTPLPPLDAVKFDEFDEMEIAELLEARRRFAIAFHPDRLPADASDRANCLMAEINGRIDRQLKARRSAKG